MLSPRTSRCGDMEPPGLRKLLLLVQEPSAALYCRPRLRHQAIDRHIGGSLISRACNRIVESSYGASQRAMRGNLQNEATIGPGPSASVASLSPLPSTMSVCRSRCPRNCRMIPRGYGLGAELQLWDVVSRPQPGALPLRQDRREALFRDITEAK